MRTQNASTLLLQELQQPEPNPDNIKLCLQFNANISNKGNQNTLYVSLLAKDEQQRSVLHYAAMHNNTEIVSLLIDAIKAELKTQQNFSKKQWQLNDECKKLLNLKDADGMTPLHRACQSGHPKMVAWLINHGADVFVKNNQGEEALKTALEHYPQQAKSYSKNKNAQEVLKILLEHNAGVGIANLPDLFKTAGVKSAAGAFGKANIIATGFTQDTPGFELSINTPTEFIATFPKPDEKSALTGKSLRNKQCEYYLKVCEKKLREFDHLEGPQAKALIELISNLELSHSNYLTRSAARSMRLQKLSEKEIKELKLTQDLEKMIRSPHTIIRELLDKTKDLETTLSTARHDMVLRSSDKAFLAHLALWILPTISLVVSGAVFFKYWELLPPDSWSDYAPPIPSAVTAGSTVGDFALFFSGVAALICWSWSLISCCADKVEADLGILKANTLELENTAIDTNSTIQEQYKTVKEQLKSLGESELIAQQVIADFSVVGTISTLELAVSNLMAACREYLQNTPVNLDTLLGNHGAGLFKINQEDQEERIIISLSSSLESDDEIIDTGNDSEVELPLFG